MQVKLYSYLHILLHTIKHDRTIYRTAGFWSIACIHLKFSLIYYLVNQYGKRAKKRQGQTDKEAPKLIIVTATPFTTKRGIFRIKIDEIDLKKIISRSMPRAITDGYVCLITGFEKRYLLYVQEVVTLQKKYKNIYASENEVYTIF